MAGHGGIRRDEIDVDTGDATLPGDLAVPAGAHGVVVFAHGSGSGRSSPRNRYVAEVLNDAGLATLLLDLLTGEEHERDSATAALRFDIDLLAPRLTAAVDRLARIDATAGLGVGLFGASTGAAAALASAAERPGAVGAVVSRGGRPDLAGAALAHVRAPTLLIIGGADIRVLGMNRDAARHLRCEHRIEIVPGAGHLFEEPGKLEAVATLAADWFARHLGAGRAWR